MNSVTSMVQPSATQAPWNCTTFGALRQHDAQCQQIVDQTVMEQPCTLAEQPVESQNAMQNAMQVLKARLVHSQVCLMLCMWLLLLSHMMAQAPAA